MRVASIVVLAVWVAGVAFGKSQQWSWIWGGLTIGLLVLRALLGPRPHHLSARAGLAAAMLGLGAILPRPSAIVMICTVIAGLGLVWTEARDSH